jgi:hypothetical protein
VRAGKQFFHASALHSRKKFFRGRAAINSTHSGSLCIGMKKHPQGFSARPQTPFDIVASKDKIGDSDA